MSIPVVSMSIPIVSIAEPSIKVSQIVPVPQLFLVVKHTSNGPSIPSTFKAWLGVEEIARLPNVQDQLVGLLVVASENTMELPICSKVKEGVPPVAGIIIVSKAVHPVAS